MARHSIDLVIPVEVDDALFLGAARAHLKGVRCFPFADPGTLKRLNNKWSFFQLATRNGIPTPHTELLEDTTPRSLARAANLRYPVMVKPLDQGFSRGIHRFETPSDLIDYVGRDETRRPLPLLVQRYVEGHDVDCTALAVEGEILYRVTQRRARDGSIVFFRDPEVEGLVKALLEAVSYSGIAHVDLRRSRDTGELMVIECNPRFWASVDCAAWAGWDFVDAGIRAALGRDLPAEPDSPVLAFPTREYLRRSLRSLRLGVREANAENTRGVRRVLIDLPAFAVARLQD